MKYYGNDPLIEGTGRQFNVYPETPQKSYRVKPVSKLNAKGKVIRSYPSISAAAEVEGVLHSTMCDRIRFGKVIDGCTWVKA